MLELCYCHVKKRNDTKITDCVKIGTVRKSPLWFPTLRGKAHYIVVPSEPTRLHGFSSVAPLILLYIHYLCLVCKLRNDTFDTGLCICDSPLDLSCSCPTLSYPILSYARCIWLKHS